MTDRLKIGQEVLIHGYVDEIRKDTVIIRNKGGYFGTVECEVTDIETPSVLDKISAEIEDIFSYVEFDEDTKTSYNMVRLEEVQRVIDKYKEESEET